MAISHIGNLITIVLVIFILLAFLLYVYKPSQAQQRRTQFIDSEDLKEWLEKWKPIVAERFDTHREVKLFANLARVICSLNEKKTKKMTRVLVGLTALVTIGELELSRRSYDEFMSRSYDYLEPYQKNSIDHQMNTTDVSQIKKLQSELDEDTWERFLRIAKFVEFPEINRKS